MRLVSTVLCLSLASPLSADPGFVATPIALRGQTSFGSTDLFSLFGVPTISQNGVVGFVGHVAPALPSFGSQRMCRWFGGTGSVLAAQGAAVPGLPGVTLVGNFTAPVIDDQGRFAFVDFQGSNQGVVMVASPGQQQTAAVAGHNAPAGASFPGSLGVIHTALQTRTGLLAFGAGSQSARDVWAGPLGGIVEQIPAGSIIEGAPAGSTARVSGWITANDLGETIALGTLFGGVHDNKRVIIHGTSQGPKVIVGPGITAGSHGTFVASGNPPNMNGDGTMGFTAVHEETPGGPPVVAAWVGRPDDFTQIAKVGAHSPGLPSSRTFSLLNTPILTSAGAAVLVANTTDSAGGGSLLGMWRDDMNGIGPQLLLTTGDPVANTVAGSTFAGLTGDPGESDVAVNALNQMAFIGIVNAPGHSPITGLITADASGSMAAVAVNGQPFLVGPGDSRIVQGIQVHTTNSAGPIFGLNGDDGQGTYLNDAGQLVFKLSFSDGSSGVFMTQVPGPAGGWLVALALIGGRRRRRVE